MTLKKLFAASAGALLALQSFVPITALGNAVISAEIQEAYEFAYVNGITTQYPIENANVFGAITRAEMAKMIANWAEKTLGMEADTSISVNFTDTASVKGDLAEAIVRATQMGLMGQGITAFRPYDTVSRAEFGTLVSRAIFGSTNDGGVPYFAAHLAALKNAGIINIVPSDPENYTEIRGYVMIQLQRATEKLDTVSDKCDDPLVILACLMGDCPAECSDDEDEKTTEVVKSGDLALTAAASEDRRAIINWVSDLDTVTLKASENITINKITLERYGYSTADDVIAVWLENAKGEKVTNERSVGTKDSVELSFTRDYRDMGKEADFVVVVQLANNTGSAAGTIGFKVTDITSSAKNLNIKNYTPYTYTMVVYEGSDVALSVKGQDRKHSYNANESYEVARFQLKANAVPVLVNGFTLTNSGTFEIDKYVKDVEVLKDGTALKNVSYTISRDELRVSFDSDELAARKNGLYVVNVTLDGLDEFGKTIEFVVENASDIRAVESKTNARVTFKVAGSDFPTAGLPLKVYTFNGDKITLTNVSLGSTVYGAQGAEDIVVAEGKVALVEPILLDTFTITTSTGALDALTIVIDGDEYEGKASGNVWTFSKVLVEKSSTIQLLADVKDDPSFANRDVSFTPSSLSKTQFGAAKYDEYNEPVSANSVVGSISIAKLRVEAAKGSLTNTTTRDVEVKASEVTNRVVLFEGEYTARRQNITLNEFVIEKVGTGLTSNDNITFFLSIGGSEVGSIDFDASNDPTGVTEYINDTFVKNGDKVSVRLEADIYATSTVGNLQYKLTLNGEDDNGNEAGSARENTRKVKVVAEGSVTVTDKNALQNTVVKSDTNVVLASFVLKAAENSADSTLSSFDFTLPSLNTGDVKVKVDGSSEPFTMSGSTFVVDGLNYNLADGIEVEISYAADLTASATPYTLTLGKVNGTAKNRTYTRLAVDALVSFYNQNSTNDETKFTFSVDAEDNASVTGLVITLDDNSTGTIAGTVNDRDFIEVANNSDWLKYVNEISYWVDGTKVTISKTDFNDFFRIGTTYAKTPKAN